MGAFKFAGRTDWELGENPLSLELERMRADGREIIDLTESNPTRCGFRYPPDVFLSPLASSDNLTYSPDPKGLFKTRKAIAAYCGTKGTAVDPEHVILTSSTSEGYTFLFRLLLNPGERVLIPAPSYPLFSFLAGLNDVQADHYFLEFTSGAWRIDFTSVEAALEKDTRAVVLVSPNNPTGSCVRKDDLAHLNDICEAQGVAIICDEVFSDYILEGHEDKFFSLAANSAVPTFVLGGISKALALPQMKLSWLMANGPAEYLAKALPRLEVIADTFLSVNTPVQQAAAKWLNAALGIQGQVRARVEGNARFLRDEFGRPGIAEVLPVEGGWYAVLKVPSAVPEGEWAVSLLIEDGVLVHPGFFFDFQEEGYIVVSLLLPPEKFAEGIRRLCGKI
jgi:aspartate/methionine/tyrosine aminotransferase